MKEGLDADAGVQNFEIGRRIRDNNDCARGCGWSWRHNIRTYKVRRRRGLELRFGRRICLDKVLQRKRLATVLRSAGMFTTSVRSGVRGETEQKLRAGEAVTPEQGAE